MKLTGDNFICKDGISFHRLELRVTVYFGGDLLLIFVAVLIACLGDNSRPLLLLIQIVQTFNSFIYNFYQTTLLVLKMSKIFVNSLYNQASPKFSSKAMAHWCK